MVSKKRGVILLVIILSFAGMFLSSATSITLTSVNSTFATISISDAVNLYAYEVNLDYTGTISGVDFANFLASDGATTTNGHSERNSISSAYESRLDNGLDGITGNGQLFNVSHSGSLSLRYVLFVNSSEAENYTYYNNSAATSSISSLGGGGGGGGTFESNWTKTYFLSEYQTSQGHLQELKKRERVKLVINGGEHYIGVREVTNNSVNISVESFLQEAVLFVGEERKFDVNREGYYDLLVKLNSIASGKASLMIRRINEKIYKDEEVEALSDEEGEEVPRVGSVMPSSEFRLILGIVLLLVAVLIFAVFMTIYRRRNYLLKRRYLRSR